MEFKKELIRRFNQVHGTTFRLNTEKHHDAIDALLEDFTKDDLMRVVEETREDNLNKVLNYWFVKSFLDVKDKWEDNVKMEEGHTDSGKLTLGLIEKALAQALTDKYLPELTDDVKDHVIKKVDEYIKKTYNISKHEVKYVMPERNGEVQGVTHEKLEEVLSYVMANEPILMVGGAGTGKNYIVKQVADLMNLDFYFSNAVSQEFKLTGFIDAYGNYHETQFYKAFKHGGIFMLDEVDASIPEVLVILNAAIANRYFDFPNGRVEAHEDFRVIAAGNTYGHGSSYEYVGRNQLDAATLDRFALVKVGYSPRIEKSLTDKADLVKFIQDFRRSVEEAGIHHVVSYRAIKRVDKLQDQLGVEQAIRTGVIKNLERDDLQNILNHMTVDNVYTDALRRVAG